MERVSEGHRGVVRQVIDGLPRSDVRVLDKVSYVKFSTSPPGGNQVNGLPPASS